MSLDHSPKIKYVDICSKLSEEANGSFMEVVDSNLQGINIISYIDKLLIDMVYIYIYIRAYVYAMHMNLQILSENNNKLVHMSFAVSFRMFVVIFCKHIYPLHLYFFLFPSAFQLPKYFSVLTNSSAFGYFSISHVLLYYSLVLLVLYGKNWKDKKHINLKRFYFLSPHETMQNIKHISQINLNIYLLNLNNIFNTLQQSNII